MSSDPAKAVDLLKALVIRLRASNRKLAAKVPPAPPKAPPSPPKPGL